MYLRCLLLQQIPQAENHALRASMTTAAILIQRWWRHVRWKRAAIKRKRSRYGQHCNRASPPVMLTAMPHLLQQSQDTKSSWRSSYELPKEPVACSKHINPRLDLDMQANITMP